MKKYFLVLFLIVASLNSFAQSKTSEAELIPVMHEGRIKPLGSFARVKLNDYFGKKQFGEMNATDWLLEVFFNPKEAYTREIFKIQNPDVIQALALPSSRKYFSFLEMYQAFNKNHEMMNPLLSANESELDLTSKQIRELYMHFMDYLGLSRSFSFFSPEINVGEKHLSYFDLVASGKMIPKKLAEYMEEDAQFKTLMIIPPVDANSELWTSPWEAAIGKNLPALKKWHTLYQSYNEKKSEPKAALALQKAEFNQKFKVELLIKKYDLVSWSISLYVLGFLALSLHFLKPSNLPNSWARTVSFVSIAAGSVFHLSFILARCFILSRPPVTNLYESILFVGLTAVIFSLIFEVKKKNSLGLFIASTLGSSLLFLSIGYQQTGDNMGMLVAVLDTNFWLATHVVTISIGYGCTLVASMMAHYYLFTSRKSEASALKALEKNIHSTLLYSLFFVILGTILGGIWADQSWGRFWGWDPKENGALLICLWLLWITHGKLAGKFKMKSFAFVTGLSSIVVAMAWFGVNLLNVGLHSYGFSSDAARSLFIFSGVELILLAGLWLLAENKLPRNRKAV